MMEARYNPVGGWYQEWVSELGDDPAMASVLAHTGEVDGARVLDLGCGEGRVTRALAERGASVVGVDVSSVLIDTARSAEASTALGISYVKDDAATSCWWDGSLFDGVVSNMALSDIEDLDGSLETVATVLRAGGWFVFTILHPCFPGADDKLPSWPPAGYFEERWWTTGGDGVRGRVGSHHRTLSTYLNALVKAGLATDAIAEPGPPVVAVHMWLTVKCRRSSGEPFHLTDMRTHPSLETEVTIDRVIPGRGSSIGHGG